MKTSIVIGLGFGDEGKGLMTDYLSRQTPNSLVVRFSGGHQAGHTVHIKGVGKHVFSQLGSGSFQDSATFYSRYCTFSPIDFVAEHLKFSTEVLFQKKPTFYLDGDAPVTTYYDVYYNRALEKINRHGSCGVGYAATVERHLSPVKIFARDIFYPEILKQKMIQVEKYYKSKVEKEYFLKAEYLNSDFKYGKQVFFESIEKCKNYVEITNESIVKNMKWNSIIFEGSQGILLDMDYGFFPNVTRSNTTSKNAIEIIKRNNLPDPQIYYMTRAYQTRHGNGWMTNEGTIEIDYKDETNIHNEWQGNFRKGILDMDLLQYAIDCDMIFSAPYRKNLTLTCFDQITDFKITIKGEKYSIGEWERDFLSFLPDLIDNFYISSSPFSADLKRYEF